VASFPHQFGNIPYLADTNGLGNISGDLGVNPAGGVSQNQTGDPTLNDLFSGNSSGESVYGYPLDILRESNPGHFIMFQAFEVEGFSLGDMFRASKVAAAVAGNALQEFQSSVEERGVVDTVDDILNQQGGQSRGKAIDSTGENNRIDNRTITQKTDILGRNKTLKDTVVLYMPPGVEVNYSANYNLAENLLGSAGRAILNSFNQTGANASLDADSSKLIKDSVIQGAVKRFRPMGGDSKVMGSITRNVQNPHLEFLFETMGQRTFSYEFIFTPRNRDEMLVVHEIIRVFKFHMHPVFNTDSAFLTMPSEFDILFYSNMKENQYMNRVMPSVLTECKVNYMPNENPDFFADSDDRGQSPSQISLTLSFAEVSTLDRRHIENGF